MKQNDLQSGAWPRLSILVTVMIAAALFVAGCGPKQPVDTAPVVTSSTTDQSAQAGDEVQLTDRQRAGFPDDEANEQTGDGTAPDEVTLEREVGETEVELSEVMTPEQEQVLNEAEGITFELDVKETEEFLKYFSFYTGRKADGSPTRGRKTFERWLKRAETYLPYVKQVFTERGIPEDVILLPFAESGYNPLAVSRAGAAGMWQFMPFTGRKYGLKNDWWIDERRDPYKATVAAADYLTTLYGMFGDWYLALAAYNAGEGTVSRAIQRSGCNDFYEIAGSSRYLRQETRHYVPKFLAIVKIVQNLEKLGFEPINWDTAPELAEVPVKGGTDLVGLAQASSMSWERFREVNPAFLRNVSPPDLTCSVRLPATSVAAAKGFLAKESSRPYAGFTRYKIRSGDSWWRIASKYNVPISVLKDVNRKQSNLLKPGQYVMVPSSARASTLAAHTPPEKTREYARERANYVVRKGDNPWTIARACKVDMDTLLRANGLTKKSTLQIGQKLYIPDSGAQRSQVAAKGAAEVKQVLSYRVRSGDTIWAIARRYNVDPASLLAWNKLTRTSVIKPGDTIKVYR